MTITDKFELKEGITVLACKGYDNNIQIAGRKFNLASGDEIRQTLTISGERIILNPKLHSDQKAFETEDMVDLSTDEARSGIWHLVAI